MKMNPRRKYRSWLTFPLLCSYVCVCSRRWQRPEDSFLPPSSLPESQQWQERKDKKTRSHHTKTWSSSSFHRGLLRTHNLRLSCLSLAAMTDGNDGLFSPPTSFFFFSRFVSFDISQHARSMVEIVLLKKEMRSLFGSYLQSVTCRVSCKSPGRRRIGATVHRLRARAPPSTRAAAWGSAHTGPVDRPPLPSWTAIYFSWYLDQKVLPDPLPPSASSTPFFAAPVLTATQGTWRQHQQYQR